MWKWAQSNRGLLASNLLSIAVALYFYERSRSYRDPSFVVLERVRIVSPRNLANAPVRILYPDGSPVRKDLTSIQFCLWNAGTSPIRDSDVLAPLTVTIEDSSARIIEARLDTVTRGVTGFAVSQDSAGKKNVLHVRFRILERGDGARCQILYDGDAGANLRIDGAIEGVRSITTSWTMAPLRLWGLIGWPLLLAILIVLSPMLIGRIGPRIWERSTKPLPPRTKVVMARTIGLSFFGILVCVAIIAIVREVIGIEKVIHNARTDQGALLGGIPSTLRPK